MKGVRVAFFVVLLVASAIAFASAERLERIQPDAATAIRDAKGDVASVSDVDAAKKRAADTGGTEKEYGGRTIAEWIALWDKKDFEKTQAAKRALVAIGKPAVPALVKLIEQADPNAREAVLTLGKMGPAARPALPLLIKAAQDRSATHPGYGILSDSARRLVIGTLGTMSWGADELIPVLEAIGNDGEESETVRVGAVGALRDMGEDAIPVLQAFARSDSVLIRKAANDALARLVEKQGIQTRAHYYTDLIERDPFDPNVPEYLGRMKRIISFGRRIHPLTQKVKALYRERLREEPDPDLAWRLATIIHDGLSGTAIEWAAPLDTWSPQRWREDPSESFATLAELLELGFRYSDPDSELWRNLGTGLAKLRLLQGDWDGMNAVLEKMGDEPIPQQDRRWLPAPPVDWSKGLRSRWGRADDSMRSGTCSLEFRFEKDGGGLKGTHVLVKRAPEPTNVVFYTGESADTLFFAPHPLSTVFPYSFGYRGKDRTMTRYAVSDESGVVRFDKLPNIPVKIEVLVPTANFPEAGPSWDLWMEVEPGKFKIAKIGRPDGVKWDEPPAVAELKEGETVYYPRMVVRPAFGMDIRNWDRVDRETFVLSWESSRSVKDARYELEMYLSAPAMMPSIEQAPVIQSAKQIVEGNQWPVGQKGVGGLHLEPGNIYMFEVRAIDDSGTVLARWPRTMVWVPWDYRESDPPRTKVDSSSILPIRAGVWWQGGFRTLGDEREETHRERVERFLSESPNAFEYDYVRVGKAWLDWHDGDPNGARAQLERLLEELPPGNLARGTATWLLHQMDDGEDPPRHLRFVPDLPQDRPQAKDLVADVGKVHRDAPLTATHTEPVSSGAATAKLERDEVLRIIDEAQSRLQSVLFKMTSRSFRVLSDGSEKPLEERAEATGLLSPGARLRYKVSVDACGPAIVRDDDGKLVSKMWPTRFDAAFDGRLQEVVEFRKEGDKYAPRQVSVRDLRPGTDQVYVPLIQKRLGLYLHAYEGVGLATYLRNLPAESPQWKVLESQSPDLVTIWFPDPVPQPERFVGKISGVVQLDLTRDANIVKWERWLAYDDASPMKIKVLDEVVLEAIEGHWFPTSFTYNDLNYDPGKGYSVPLVVDRTSFTWERVNEPVSDADFTLDSPVGSGLIGDADASRGAVKPEAVWGEPVNGLQCRLEPWRDERVEERGTVVFATAKDMAFRVHLKNVGNRPVDLAEMPENRAKYRGPLLFRFDFFDLDGKLVERPQCVPLYTSPYVIVERREVSTLPAGDTAVYEARVRDWLNWPEFDLKPGRYRARVTYVGGKATNEELRKRGAVPCWEGEAVSNLATITIADDPREEDPELVWGGGAGLRAALELVPRQETYSIGQAVDMRLHVKNVGEQTVQFTTSTRRQGDPVVVEDEHGNAQRVDFSFYSGRPLIVRWILPPGQKVVLDGSRLGIVDNRRKVDDLGDPTPHVLICKPGRYFIRRRVFIPNVTSSRISQEGDWRGTLETGARELTVVPSAEGEAQPRMPP